jgi:GNAT superfamily N-acetyltransferase
MPKFQAPVPLTVEHDTAAFDCGKPALDDFLKLHALDKQRAMLSRTYVVDDGERVVAYYTLAQVDVRQAAAPKKLGRGMPDAIPAMLMARFAVDLEHAGQGLGRSLFTDAIRRTWAAMESGPAPMRLFVVDAKDEEAKGFYKRFDMIPSPLDPMRLFLSYKTLRSAFEET